MDALSQLSAQPMLVLGLTLVAGSLLGALVLLVRGRRRAAPAAVTVEPTEGEVDAEVNTEADPEVDAESDTGAEPSSVTVRALRAQVRVLEEALASASAPQTDLDVDVYRRQVRCAVQAVAQDADEQMRHVVARVAAAIDRLDAPAGFARPVLPAERIVQVAPSAASAPVDPRVGLVAVAPLVETAAPQPEVEPVPAAHSTVADPAPAPAPAPVLEAEVVLPVPPPAPAATRRSRRRLRHSAA